MARPERFELPTPWFVARYSIQLSYGRLVLSENFPDFRTASQTVYAFMAESAIHSLRLPLVRGQTRWRSNSGGSNPIEMPTRCADTDQCMAEREGFEPSMGF